MLAEPGHTTGELRRVVEARAARLSGRGDGEGGPADGLSASLARYVDTVALHANQVTDGDVATLRRSGVSEDAVFEITVAAALGAALGRLERGLAALRGQDPD